MRLRFIAFTALLCAVPAVAQAQTPAAMTLSVDATQAPRNLFAATVTMPVTPGHCGFSYPQWIPAWETPSGPIQNLVDLHVSAGGKDVAWHRDPVNLYAFTCDAPSASSITVSMKIIGSTPDDGYNATLRGTNDVAVLQWSSLLVYPTGEDVYQQPIDATLKLPHGWGYGSALIPNKTDGDSVSFERTMLNQLVDSPLHMGRFHRAIQLSTGESPTWLDIVADSPEALDISKSELTGMKHLVQEAPALYGPPHYSAYHFLLSLSDPLGGGGFEHHQSSDDRSTEDYLTDVDAWRAGVDLMSHEYSHSWNGKYRRPIGMVIKNYNVPMQDDLIWVYEGMNEYLGKVLAIRARMATPEDMRGAFADIAALESYRTGRAWRPLIDTAVSAPYLYTVDGPWTNLRRTAGDFYDEGLLVWLDVDATIRQQTHGQKSLDDYLHIYTQGGGRYPSIKPYTYDDIVSMLNETVAYDWRAFFDTKVYSLQPQAPLEGIERSGWRLVYRDKPNPYESAALSTYHYLDFVYSVGLQLSEKGTVGDVVPDSPAGRAGMAPGMAILAVNGRTFTPERLSDAITNAKTSHQPIALIATNGSFLHTYSLAYDGGLRYPWLERIPNTPDYLSAIFAPKTFKP